MDGYKKNYIVSPVFHSKPYAQGVCLPCGCECIGEYSGSVSRRYRERQLLYSGRLHRRFGIERSYENILRGEKGVEILLRDAHGRVKGRYEDGRYDVAPVSGKI